MATSTYNIQVTDQDGNITVNPASLVMNLNESVSWTLTPASDSDAALTIDFTGACGFKHKEYSLNESGGFGIIATAEGNYSYTVSAADGRSVDPVIIVNPVNLPPSAQK
jgi:hypothetical protein